MNMTESRTFTTAQKCVMFLKEAAYAQEGCMISILKQYYCEILLQQPYSI